MGIIGSRSLWRDAQAGLEMKPLKVCKLRTAGLASVNSAKFGLVRRNANGTLRAHQGIDLQADIGTPVYAVEDGVIAGVNMGKDGYGFTISLKFGDRFAFYAHLSEVFVNVGEIVKAGTLLAKSGASGNASGMTSIARGGHLHFEIRTMQNAGLGLTGRLDPLTFVDLD
jgi:murein DD-endopeptidase MepM/ murein hydrolase activator NlpD